MTVWDSILWIGVWYSYRQISVTHQPLKCYILGDISPPPCHYQNLVIIHVYRTAWFMSCICVAIAIQYWFNAAIYKCMISVPTCHYQNLVIIATHLKNCMIHVCTCICVAIAIQYWFNVAIHKCMISVHTSLPKFSNNSYTFKELHDSCLYLYMCSYSYTVLIQCSYLQVHGCHCHGSFVKCRPM